MYVPLKIILKNSSYSFIHRPLFTFHFTIKCIIKRLKRFINWIFFFIAICDDKTNRNGACHQYQLVSKKFGWQWEHSKGSCLYPGQCSCSSVYFYNDGPRCTGNIVLSWLHLDNLQWNIKLNKYMLMKIYSFFLNVDKSPTRRYISFYNNLYLSVCWWSFTRKYLFFKLVIF